MKPNEVQKVINDGIFACIDDINGVIRDGDKLLPHRCNNLCLICAAPGRYHCRKLNNVAIYPENKNHVLKPLSNEYSNACLYQLIKIGLVNAMSVNNSGYETFFKSILHFSSHLTYLYYKYYQRQEYIASWRVYFCHL